MKDSIEIQHRRRWALPTGLSPASPIRRRALAKPLARAAVVVSLLFLATAFALTLHFSATTAEARADLRAVEERYAEERAGLSLAESELAAVNERLKRLQLELKDLLNRQRALNRSLADVAAENQELQEEIEALE